MPGALQADGVFKNIMSWVFYGWWKMTHWRGDIQTDGGIGETWLSVVSGGFDVLRWMRESDEK